jgi:hypothetical protein
MECVHEWEGIVRARELMLVQLFGGHGKKKITKITPMISAILVIRITIYGIVNCAYCFTPPFSQVAFAGTATHPVCWAD